MNKSQKQQLIELREKVEQIRKVNEEALNLLEDIGDE